MPEFVYSALNQKDAYLRGTIAARTIRQAAKQLESQGLSVITLKREAAETWLNRELGVGLGLQEKILITRHLHTMLEAGLGLDQALRTLADQAPQARVKRILLDLHRSVQSGQPFHQALAQHPRYFNPLFVNLVKVGEASGKLDENLAYLLDQQENDYRLRTKVMNAMLYPSIILTALILMVSAMLVFVIPRIKAVLESYDVALPLQTRILVALSSALSQAWYIIFPALIALFLLFRRFISRGRGQRWWDSVLLKLAPINVLVREVNLARIMRTMASTLKSGLPIDRALELTAAVTHQTFYRATLDRAVKLIRRGAPLGDILRGSPHLFPPMTTRMIEVGEKTGKLDHMLDRLARFYEESVDTKLTNLSSIIEPLMILLIGLIVGYVAISVMTPIWSFSQTV